MLAILLSVILAAATPPGNLEQQLSAAVKDVDGTIGIAFINETDTVTVNNNVRYPMMSVFKLHEALATADAAPFDSIITVKQSELDHNTWSPMLALYPDSIFNISLRQLVGHALVSSDNNASNILFDRIVSPGETECYVKTIAPDTTFAIRHSEAAMKRNNALSYENYSSPLSAALLIRQLFTTDLLPAAPLDSIRKGLTAVTTGSDRIGAVINPADGTLFAHKTGSGYRDHRGRLIAFNDVAYIRLPDGRDYSLAIMIRDFAGTEPQAAQIMATLSQIVRTYVNNNGH